MNNNDKYAYALIEFEYEQEQFVSAVPIGWINFESMECKWPKKQERQAIFKKNTPHSDWITLQNISVKDKFVTYQEAIFHEKKVVQTSESEAELENNRRKVKKPYKYRPQSETNTLSISPPPQLIENDMTSGSDTNEIQVGEYILLPDATLSPASDSVSNTQGGYTLDDVMKMLLKMEQQLSIVTYKLNSLENKLQFSAGPTVKKTNLLPKFPLQQILELQEFDELLSSNEDCCQEMIHLLKHTGGTSEKNLTYRVMEKIFSNYLGQFCSVQGKKGNFKIGNLKIFQIMKEAVRLNYKDLTDKQFEESVMAWLKQSKQRFQREDLKTRT